MDDQIATFVSFTGATPEQGQQYLQLADGNIEQAVQLFLENPDLGASAAAPPSAAPIQPPRPQTTQEDPINISDDEAGDGFMAEDDVAAAQSKAARAQPSGPSVEDDEAMARRLQEEMYGAGGGGGGGAQGGFGEEGVRAPMARTTETLVGPGSSVYNEPDDMQAAVMQQLMARQRRAQGAPGIFNQRAQPSIWSSDDPDDSEAHRQALARATGGASEATSKSNLLAELFRPPVDLMSNFTWEQARDEGKETEVWILVNIQDPSIFDCQVLNRDIWKNAQIKETVKENFIFLQYAKSDPRGNQYCQYYFHNRESEDAYPHIAIVDPRTGEQVKVWSGSPAPKPSEFLMDLHEFLDRYSLKVGTKLPVATKKQEKKKDVGAMSEEEMLQMAMQNSLANGSGSGPKDSDPDALTKAKTPPAVDSGVDIPTNSQPVIKSTDNDTPFSRISSSNPQIEPMEPVGTARIQFRYSGGRVVRRFNNEDPVRRVYEWLKASPLDGKDGVPFELISMGRNLMDSTESSIEEMKLNGGTVMVEFVED